MCDSLSNQPVICSKPESEPTIDFTQIHFPSDTQTIAELRIKWPSSFDEYNPPTKGQLGLIRRVCSLDDTLGSIIDMERIYADLVFRETLKIPCAGGREASSGGMADELAEDYESYAWANGEHTASELVHEIKRQVLHQTEQYRGR